MLRSERPVANGSWLKTMTDIPELSKPKQENWGSKLGVVLAVSGSAVGLGNFLRFPGQAVNNGGGAFMIPYIISFLILGIPIAWCEWTMGRLGGRYRQNSAPGIMYALWPSAGAKGVGAFALLIPVVIYMYYVLLEAWCLDYFIDFASGGFTHLYDKAVAGLPEGANQAPAIVGATKTHFYDHCGLNGHFALIEGGRMIWLVLACFLVNFVIIYQGVTRGIEKFCKFAMPLLILCAVIILVRVLTLPGIEKGLGFMWNPDWAKLSDPQVWLAASGQIFFSLSVGFGLILCYSSYVKKDEDVVITSLSASSTNEFCEVILGGLIVVPAAFLFLGAKDAQGGTFDLGFITLPAIMHFMPGGPLWGSLFGAMWFGLLFVAAVTSSLSMLQPAIAFLEDGFGLNRRASVAVLAIITAIGTVPTMLFSRKALALDYTDFWCNLCMIIAATMQVLIFGWVIGAEKGRQEMNRGASLKVPRVFNYLIRYVTPAFLIIILVMWSINKFPGYLSGMVPENRGNQYQRAVYQEKIAEHFADQKLNEADLAEKSAAILGDSKWEPVDQASLPAWLSVNPQTLAERRDAGRFDANVARFVFLGILVFYILLYVLSDLACRYRIGRTIDEAKRDDPELESAI